MSSPLHNLVDLWNIAGTAFTAIKMDVTDSASASASKLIDLQVGSTTKFSVTKVGQGYFAGNVGIGTTVPAYKLDVTNTAGKNVFLTTDASGAYVGTYGYDDLCFQTNHTNQMILSRDGSVGIGTTSPTNKLGVSGAAAIGSSYAGTYTAPSNGLLVQGNVGIGVTNAAAGFLYIAAGTTAKSQINLASSTAPTSPNNGDIWFDGSALKIRIGGVTKTITVS